MTHKITLFQVQKPGMVKPVQPIQPMSQQAAANQATLQEQGQQQVVNSQQKKKQKDDSDDEFIKGKKVREGKGGFNFKSEAFQ